MPRGWLQPLGGTAGTPDWFDQHAPPQSATPPPGTFTLDNPPPGVDVSRFGIGLREGVNPDAPASGLPVGLQGQPGAPGPAMPPARESVVAPWVSSLSGALNQALEHPVRTLADVGLGAFKVGVLGRDPRQPVMPELMASAEGLGNVANAGLVGVAAGFRGLQEGASPYETVQRAYQAARDQARGIPGELPSEWFRSRGVQMYPNLPQALGDLATDVTVDPLNAFDLFKGATVAFGMVPMLGRRAAKFTEAARAAKTALQPAWNAATLGKEARAASRAGRVLEIASPLVDASWAPEFEVAAKAAGFDQRTINATGRTIEGIARMFSAHPSVLPQTADPEVLAAGLTAWKENADFVWTIDIDQTCARVRKYWQSVDALEQQLQRPMSADELLVLGQEMRKSGDIPGCIFCYVEAGRRARATFRYRMATMEPADVRPLITDKDEAKIFDWMARRDELRKALGWDLPTYAANMTRHDLRAQNLAAGGARELAVDHFDAWAAASKASNVTGHSLYGHEILRFSDETARDLNARAGLRWWSSTDLDPTQLLESIKALADASVRGLMSHFYTKEPYAVEIFGKTGMKMNLSVAVKRDPATGRMVSDAYNGMPLDVALALRKKYRNAGTMLVGTDKDAILWGLDSPDIDMIIPHHSGNWQGGVEKYGAFGLDNFSGSQHEHWAGDFRPPGATGAKSSVKAWAGERLYFKHWLEQAHGNPRKAADLYLDFCRKNGITPKFSEAVYQDHVTMKTIPMPDFSQHKNYYKLLTDYARVDSPQVPVDVRKFDQGKALEYLDQFVKGGGWTGRETPNPQTLADTMAAIARGDVARLAERERALVAPPEPNAVNVVPAGLLRQAGAGQPVTARPWQSSLREIAEQQDEITRRIDAIERGAPRVSSRVSWDWLDQQNARDAWLDSASIKDLQAEYAALNAKRRDLLAKAKKAKPK